MTAPIGRERLAATPYSRIAAEPSLPEPALWVVAAQADACSAKDRAVFAERAAAWIEGRGDRLLLVTCHRAELYGTGERPASPDRLELGVSPELWAQLRTLEGTAAVRHAFRLAAGLESAVIGEDQVLHQVRELREKARTRGDLEPRLSRLFEMALAVGRRARSRPGRRGPHARWSDDSARAAEGDGEARESLATRALDWLAERVAAPDEGPILVVGAGEMGRLVAFEAHRRGRSVIVASRDPEHARTAAAAVSGRGLDLAEAAEAAVDASGVVVALAGRWREVSPDGVLPPTVDLSSPPALAPGRAVEQIDIDALYLLGDQSKDRLAARRYARMAEPMVEEATTRYLRWSAGRASSQVLREVRDRAEHARQEELARLLRRLPELDPHERDLVEAFSQQLVATILHRPTVRLREDVDGSAAEAAARLFAP